MDARVTILEPEQRQLLRRATRGVAYKTKSEKAAEAELRKGAEEDEDEEQFKREREGQALETVKPILEPEQRQLLRRATRGVAYKTAQMVTPLIRR
jgi:hypothetical protein